ncbi:MAG: F0F1 ATP synthase subunit delta [Chloroflexi bacterium]|nr:F0F1 ATP synthase subunit delta [Chloroflexota bacterium]
MANKTYARRYAQAVFEMALQAKELDRWQSDLAKAVAMVGDAEIATLLASPRLPFEDKAGILSESLEGINPLALNLVLLLVTRDSLSMIGDIADDYRRRLDSYRGIEMAEVTTAVPLDDKDKARLAEHLGAVVGKKVIIKYSLDPGLIGGVVARIGGKLLDGSTRSKLAALKRELMNAKL